MSCQADQGIPFARPLGKITLMNRRTDSALDNATITVVSEKTFRMCIQNYRCSEICFQKVKSVCLSSILDRRKTGKTAKDVWITCFIDLAIERC